VDGGDQYTHMSVTWRVGGCGMYREDLLKLWPGVETMEEAAVACQEKGMCMSVMLVDQVTGKVALLYNNRGKRFVYYEEDESFVAPETSVGVPSLGLSLRCRGVLLLVLFEGTLSPLKKGMG